jgi:hypothetical protein
MPNPDIANSRIPMKTTLKKLFSMGAVMAFALSTSGCGTIYMNAPPDSGIKLLSRNAPATVKIEKHIWFKWWGGEPLHPEEVHAATIIKDAGLKEARIRMTNTFVDGLYSIMPGIFGFPRRTLIVEGNREITRDVHDRPKP